MLVVRKSRKQKASLRPHKETSRWRQGDVNSEKNRKFFVEVGDFLLEHVEETGNPPVLDMQPSFGWNFELAFYWLEISETKQNHQQQNPKEEDF